MPTLSLALSQPHYQVHNTGHPTALHSQLLTRNMSQGDSSTMVRLHPHQRLSFDTASRSLRDGGARSRDCSPNPRERSSRDRSARERSPQRSPLRTRRAPSPLRHAQFRPLAMEYANSHENSPQPTSCKYYNAGDEEEATPGGTPGGYCSTYRTVG